MQNIPLHFCLIWPFIIIYLRTQAAACLQKWGVTVPRYKVEPSCEIESERVWEGADEILWRSYDW